MGTVSIKTSNGGLILNVTDKAVKLNYDSVKKTVELDNSQEKHIIFDNVRSEKEADKIIENVMNQFNKAMPENQGTIKREETEYYSTWTVSLFCFFVLLACGYLAWKDQQQNSLPNISQTPNQEIPTGYAVSQEFVDQLVATDIDFEEHEKRKSELLEIQTQLKTMDPGERIAFLKSDDVKQKLNIKK